MIVILFAVLGGLMISVALEIRIRKPPHLGAAGRLLHTSLALTGTAMLLTAFLMLTWEDPPWLQAATIGGTVVAVVIGNFFSERRARGAAIEISLGPCAQAQGPKISRRGRDALRQMGAFSVAFAVGTIGFVLGLEIWNGRPGPYGITFLAILGSSLGAVLAIRHVISSEST